MLVYSANFGGSGGSQGWRPAAGGEKLKSDWVCGVDIPLPTQMDDHPSSNRRKKSDKAKEKHERTPYSSQHVRKVANALVAAATKAGSGSRKNKNK
jgi:hypothetical protein